MSDKTENTKRCCRCKRTLAIANFGVYRKHKDGLREICKECRNAAQMEANRRNIDVVREKSRKRYAAMTDEGRRSYRESTLNARLKTKYGITRSEFDAMVDAVGGKCQICGCRILKRGWTGDSAVVDHCHDAELAGLPKRERIRGILCRRCNLGIGQLGESVERLYAAIRYLVSYKRKGVSKVG
jgi:hypothetical protein